MAKKSKAERKAIRKEGWKEATQGLHEMYGKSTMDTLASMGKGFTQGVKSGRPSSTTNPKANLIGKGIAGLGGAVVEAVKNIPQTAKTMAKGNWKFIKGVFKGIFNHPDWYAYRNVLSEPAYNVNRPFDTVSMASAGGSRKAAPGIGATHIVKQNVIYHDMRDSQSFKLAAIEAFKAIRLDLKSNLPYTQDTYDNFIAVAVSVFTKAKAVERCLGWYNVTRADIPELQPAVASIPINYYEIGKVASNKINMLLDSEIGNTMNKYRKLQSVISNIAIPKKLAEYISWWMGSVFIDQSAPNAQIYLNELRDCPVYGVDSNGDIAVKEKWDILTGSIDTVIDEALVLLNSFGIMNADIIKTGRYGLMSIANTEANQYQPITLSDPEFFTILINSYHSKRAGTLLETLFNPEYIRVDALEDLGPANLVGVTNALAYWADTIVPFTIESQCAYILTNSGFRSPRGINVQLSISGTTWYDIGVFDTEPFWYQIVSELDNDLTVDVIPNSTSTIYNYTADVKYAGSGLGTITASSLTLFNGLILNTFLENDNFTLSKTIAEQASGRFENITITVTAGVITGVVFDSSTTKRSDWVKNATGQINLITLTSGTDFSVSTYAFGTRVHNYLTLLGTTVTIPSASRSDILSMFTTNSNIYDQIITQIMYTTTTTAKTAKVFGKDTLSNVQFADLVDYHIPIVCRENFVVSDGTADSLRAIGVSHLIKETYVPLLFNFSDVEAVLYWMYLGLFSM